MKQTLLIILLLSFSVGFSQQEYNHNDLIEMDNGLWSVKFSDEPITGKVYGNFGEVRPYKKVFMGNLLNGKKEGRWKSYFHSTGKKKYDLNFRDGKEDGLQTWWYGNGQKAKEETYKDGKEDGLQTWWYENGQKAREETYKDGELIESNRWDEEENEAEMPGPAPPGKVWSPEHGHWHDAP
ncbi:MAG TPA: hypothetical protein EYN45_02545 [Candidatus Marinimicrobia bacterium]|nr:hypothetical protein [Candidatus Neomarinimicrobiota bacterium]